MVTYSWKKWVSDDKQEEWAQRLLEDETLAGVPWSISPGKKLLLEIFVQDEAMAQDLKTRWGGAVQVIPDESWLKPFVPKELKFGKKLEVKHELEPGKTTEGTNQLVIPYGLAFGSGEHETTYMLLRSLVRREDLAKTAILDLGTGSGILALAARKLGATDITGIDCDEASIKTCQQNELMNFGSSHVVWKQGDSLKWRSKRQWPLVLANLFSDLLIAMAPKMVEWVEPGGEAWLSGIMRHQLDGVELIYTTLGFEVLACKKKDKWVMFQFRRLS